MFEWSNGGLSNNGEDIRLRNDNNNTIDYVDYDDGGLWPDADGDCPSMELIDASSNNDTSGAWAESDGYGSPGEVNSVSAVQGCTDLTASNYDSTALLDDGSCTYSAPSADFAYTIVSNQCGRATINFTNNSSGAANNNWSFTLLGETSNEFEPSLEVPSDISFDVNLEVSNGMGAADTSITVTVPPSTNTGTFVTFRFTPDCFGDELSWTLSNSANEVIASVGAGTYPITTGTPATVNYEFCLPDDCYTVDLADTYGDGFAGNGIGFTSGETCGFDGTYSFLDENNNVISEYLGAADFGLSSRALKQRNDCVLRKMLPELITT